MLGCDEVSTVPSLVAYLQHSATGVDEDGQRPKTMQEKNSACEEAN